VIRQLVRLIALVALTAHTTAWADVGDVGPVPETVRADYAIDSDWYAKYVEADGIPIIGSSLVSDRALLRARNQTLRLLQNLPPQVTATLRAQRNRIVILGVDETVRDIPEFAAAFPDPSVDRGYWGGFGATALLPITAGTEANILAGFNNENVFVHELAHTIAERGLALIDPNFQSELADAFAHARATGRWHRTYAGSSIIEYWAEGTQSYFNVNREGPLDGDGLHNDINSRTELELYDPLLFAMLSRTFGPSWLNEYRSTLSFSAGRKRPGVANRVRRGCSNGACPRGFTLY
jgi:hypothetical protein